MSEFNHFPKAMFKFLSDLAANNNRDWFLENKPRYERDVVKPTQAFIEAIGEYLPNLSPSFIADTRRSGGSMFRIYRDARFSKDKRPYKTNVGCQFRHFAGKDAHCPGFYLHLSPNEVFVGAGIWAPKGADIDKIRTAIVEYPDDWKKIVNQKKFKQYFDQYRGESLKRPPRGYDKDAPHMDYLKRKSFTAFKQLDPQSALEDGFLDEIKTAFTTAGPMVAFITKALGHTY